MYEKLKSWLLDDQLFNALLIVAVAGASFVLGSYSATVDTSPQQAAAPIIMNANAVSALTVEERVVIEPSVSQNGQTGQFVASKSGARYHHISCPGAKQIKEENKIFFSSTQEAEASGYTKALNCSQW